jgi:hypothetical protein
MVPFRDGRLCATNGEDQAITRESCRKLGSELDDGGNQKLAVASTNLSVPLCREQ